MNDEARQQLLGAGMKLPLAGFVLDLGAQALLAADGKPVELRPRAWAVLRHLALAAGRLVTKEELLQAIWPGLVVTDASLTQAVCDVRDALGEAGHRLLKTVPRRGYMLVADAVAAPVAAATVPPVQEADRPSIAVLAFGGPPRDPDGASLARGVARDLVAELARNADLRVISALSSFSFDGSGTPPGEIGRRLRCRFLVDGSVRRDGETLRIDVELIECADARVVWSAQHTIGAADVPALRDALMRRIAASLNGKSRHIERRALARPPASLDVYALTVRGIMLTTHFNAAATREGRALLQEAVRTDPNYAPAWAWLGYLNVFDVHHGYTGEWDERRLPECRAQIARALELDPDIPAAYRALSHWCRAARDFDGALAAAERAVALAPSSAECVLILSNAQAAAGDFEAAVRTGEAAMQQDALASGWIGGSHAANCWAAGRPREACRLAGEALGKSPQYWPARLTHMYARAELGEQIAARGEAAGLLVSRPGTNARYLQDRFHDRAAEVRSRIAAICAAVGIPAEPASRSDD